MMLFHNLIIIITYHLTSIIAITFNDLLMCIYVGIGHVGDPPKKTKTVAPPAYYPTGDNDGTAAAAAAAGVRHVMRDGSAAPPRMSHLYPNTAATAATATDATSSATGAAVTEAEAAAATTTESEQEYPTWTGGYSDPNAVLNQQWQQYEQYQQYQQWHYQTYGYAYDPNAYGAAATTAGYDASSTAAAAYGAVQPSASAPPPGLAPPSGHAGPSTRPVAMSRMGMAPSTQYPQDASLVPGAAGKHIFFIFSSKPSIDLCHS
jgi:hypothetical protein